MKIRQIYIFKIITIYLCDYCDKSYYSARRCQFHEFFDKWYYKCRLIRFKNKKNIY